MTTEDDPSLTSADEPPLSEKALEKNQQIQGKMESCAAELSDVNETAKKEMAAGTALQQVESTLARSKSVENKVQECADDLHELNVVLAKEVDSHEQLNRELMETGRELSTTQDILSKTQDDLAIAHEVGVEANALLMRSEEIHTELRRDITKGQVAEARLFEEKESLRITLSCIGDAVITTDISGKVTYLNLAAETMTGWTSQQAKGLPLPDVFHIVNSQTNESAPNPVERVLREKQPVGLVLHTLLTHRSATSFLIEDSATPIRDQQGDLIGAVLVFHDITHAQKMATQMTYQASHDALTGLINRHEFERRLEHALQTGKQDAKQHTLLYLDLDQFKIVNDTCSHLAGDELLRQLTSVLQTMLRSNDTLARLGGDEFGVLLESCPTEPALRMADLLRQTVQEFHFVWKNKVFQLGASIGLITFGNDKEELTDILRMAHAACHLAKDKGRNRVQIYTSENKELAQRHSEMEWVGRIQKALKEKRFVLYSQKILQLGNDAKNGNHYEMLLRMRDEEGTLVPPMAFIPAAERYGLMCRLDRWVIATAFAQYEGRHPPGSAMGTCAINLSAASICDENFHEFVVAQFDLYKVPPGGICFEITETSAIANLAQAAILIRKLKALGCRFSLDDFGSGMSSFTYLKHLPVDYLKIDGGFVKDMMDDPIDRAMVEAINHIGHVMHIETIAEFVENNAILEALRTMGVDYAQGYGVEKPRLSEFPVLPSI